MTKDNRRILNEDEFMEMMENRYGEITTEFVKDGIVREARVINIPLKYFLVDILDDFIKDKYKGIFIMDKDIICDLYNDGWDFTKDIDFLEIVGE